MFDRRIRVTPMDKETPTPRNLIRKTNTTTETTWTVQDVPNKEAPVAEGKLNPEEETYFVRKIDSMFNIPFVKAYVKDARDTMRNVFQKGMVTSCVFVDGSEDSSCSWFLEGWSWSLDHLI